MTPNDPSFGQLWGLQNSRQLVNGSAGTAAADLSAPAASDVDTRNGSIVVGVVDTGIDYNHPDLAANVWVTHGTGVADDQVAIPRSREDRPVAAGRSSSYGATAGRVPPLR